MASALRDWRAPVLLVALALLAYAGPGPREFVYDDQFAVQANPVVNGALPLSSAWTHDFWGMQGARTVGTYRPITVLSLGLDWRLGGGRPWFFRLASIDWHLLVVLAVFLVWRRLIGEWAAFVAAALVAVLAAPSEAVFSFVGRADLLCALWVVLGLWAHRTRGWSGLIGASLCFGLALGSKETGVLAPVAWLVLDALLPVSGFPLRARLPRLLAYVVPFGVYLAGRTTAMGALLVPRTNSPLHNPLLAADRMGRLFGAAKVFVTPYLAGIVDPWRRIYDCSAQACGPSQSGDVLAWLGLLLVLGVIAGIWLLRRKSPGAAAGLTWFGLFFLPASNLLVLGPTIYGERLLYTPLIGLAVAVGVGLEKLARQSALAWGAVALLALPNIVAVRQRQADWNSQTALVRSGLKHAPDSAVVQADAAVVAMRHGDYAQAERSARRSIALYPDYMLPHRELAAALFSSGRLDEAGPEFERAYALGRDETLVHDYASYLGSRGEYAKGLEVVDEFIRSRGRTPELAAIREKLQRRLAQGRK